MLAIVLSYVVTCALLHNILSHHYQDSCSPSWWSLSVASSTYCDFIQKTLHILRSSPLLVVPALQGLLPQLPRA